MMDVKVIFSGFTYDFYDENGVEKVIHYIHYAIHNLDKDPIELVVSLNSAVQGDYGKVEDIVVRAFLNKITIEMTDLKTTRIIGDPEPIRSALKSETEKIIELINILEKIVDFYRNKEIFIPCPARPY